MIIGPLIAFVSTNGSLVAGPPVLLDISANRMASIRNTMPAIMGGIGPLVDFGSRVAAAPSRTCCQNGVTKAPPHMQSAITDSFEYTWRGLLTLFIMTSKIIPIIYRIVEGLIIMLQFFG